MDGVKIDEIEISSRLLLTYDGVPLGHGVSQLARHPKVRQLGVTLHIEQNVASLEEIITRPGVQQCQAQGQVFCP